MSISKESLVLGLNLFDTRINTIGDAVIVRVLLAVVTPEVRIVLLRMDNLIKDLIWTMPNRSHT